MPYPMSRRFHRCALAIAICCLLPWATSVHAQVPIQADLLVVGGTESGCAAAVQAARMGVKRIVLVNDIEWLGGQFSAEALGAIDENRGHKYNDSVPIPRSGIFREVIDAIEEKNAQLYGGVRRPGNTRVITTSRPIVSEEVFRELLAPYEATGQIKRYSNYAVASVLKLNDSVRGVAFRSTKNDEPLTVAARFTIDATDWGDVIQQSGAAWEAGVDAQAKYGEPSAPQSGEPPTDLNPITWCLILEEQAQQSLIERPDGYDVQYFNGKWGWIDEEFAYTTRRLVDGQGFAEIDHPDVLLVNTPPIDYPLDVYPAEVAEALEATEPGASKQSLVAMTPQQRAIVFADAKNHSLKFLYYLQQRFPKFRKMALSEEFGTEDLLPPKPYIRESLRLGAQYMVKEQDVIGYEGRPNYAKTMFPDAVFSWQFELDFHPTRRSFRTEAGAHGPWEADFRGDRRFGRSGTGRCVFPVRSLVPMNTTGLLGAQKNLGYTSIVSSSCRLHDQSIHAGQASGAVAAVAIQYDIEPARFFRNKQLMAEVWSGLLDSAEGAAPLAIWPFADVDPYHPSFVAIQQLALRKLLPLDARDVEFRPDLRAGDTWIAAITDQATANGYRLSIDQIEERTTRGEAAIFIWEALSTQDEPAWKRQDPDDADLDGVADAEDPLPYTPGQISWTPNPMADGIPELGTKFPPGAKAFNFTAANLPEVEPYFEDVGSPFQPTRGYGWLRDLSKQTRLRETSDHPIRDGFVFTRGKDTWECIVDPGRWRVYACLGDSGHDQPGQHLNVEGIPIATDIDTAAGSFHEVETVVDVQDSRLSITLGTDAGGANSCLNWLILVPAK